MLRLLRWIFTGDGHRHEWVIVKQVMVEVQGGSRYDRYILQCRRCGNMKVKNTDRFF